MPMCPQSEDNKKRLELLYPGKHKLEIYKNESRFTVYLEIQI